MKSELSIRLAVWAAAGFAVAALNRGLAPEPGMETAGPPGVSWAVALGGSRALAADITWLRAYEAWQRRDAARTESLIRATVALDSRPDVFWVNGARVFAHDFAAWEAAADPNAPRAVVDARRERHVRRALEFLGEASRRGPSAAVQLEIAALQLHTPGDLQGAAESYRAAALLPGAPWLAGRMHARLLVRLGRRDAAARWLREWLPKLPADDPAAQKEFVRRWLAELEPDPARPD